MMTKDTLEFLFKLKYNNNREWFQENKPLYEKALAEVEGTLKELIPLIAQFDPTVAGLEPKDCLFRIYRDVRFSKDKSPYKMHFGALIAQGGKSVMNSTGYYFHIEPGNSLVASGLFHPGTELLEKIRKKIETRLDEFKAIVNRPEFRKAFTHIEGEKLKNVPRGFEKDSPAAEFLKFKEYLVVSHFSDEQTIEADFPQKAAQKLKAALELNQFFRE